MAGEPALYARLELRIKDFEKQMAKANRVAGQGLGSIERRAQKSSSIISRAMGAANASLASFGMGLAGGIVGGGVVGVLTNIRRELESLAKTSDTAKMLGVNVERLQELRYAADEAGMAANNFDVAFRRFIRRSAEAAQGTGAAKDAFKELGISLVDNNGNLKQSEDLLSEVADQLSKMPNSADKLRLAFKLFDTDGAQMVNVLANGSQGLKDMAAEARPLGAVVDAALIEKAAEADKAWAKTTLAMKGGFSQLAAELGGPLATEFDSILKTIREIAYSWDALKKGQFQDALGMYWGKDAEKDLAKRQIKAGLGHQLTASEAAGYYQASGMVPPKENKPAPPGSGGNSMDRLAKSYADIEKIANQRLATMAMEQQALGMTTAAAAALRFEHDMLNAAERIGVQLTPQQTAALKAKAQEMGALAEATEEAAEKQQRLADLEGMTTNAISGFVSDLRNGVSAAEAFGNALNKIADQLIDMAIRNLVSNAFGGLGGGGGGGGFFSGIGRLFGFAEGGYTGNGGKHEAKGVVHGGEYVFSKAAVQKAGAGNLHALHRQLKGYANGGLVGGSVRTAAPAKAAQPVVIQMNNDFRGVDASSRAYIESRLAVVKQDAIKAAVAAVPRAAGSRPGYFQSGR